MKVQNIEQYITILKEWLPKDASVAIAMEGKYVYYLPGIYPIHIEEGQEVDQCDLAYEVSLKQTKIEKLIQQAQPTESYYGIGYPIYIQNQQAVVIIALPPTSSEKERIPLTFLTGKYNDCWSPISVENISYIESLQKKTLFHNNKKPYQTIYTLKELTNLLPSYFIRIHRSYIVNIKNIKEISRDFSSTISITLSDNTTLPVSQSYVQKVRAVLGF